MRILRLSILLISLSTYLLGCGIHSSIALRRTVDEQKHPAYNETFQLEYAVVGENDQLYMVVKSFSGEMKYKLLLEDTEAFDEVAFCQEIDTCKSPRLSRYISWSPDDQFLMVYAGRFDGFLFIPASTLKYGIGVKEGTVSVAIVNRTKKFTTALFHKAVGWAAPDSYVFAAGLSGSNFMYRFDPKTNTLIGRPFDLSDDSTVTSFIETTVDDYNTQSTLIDLFDVKDQLQQLDL